jgi:hypothetical protein
MLLRTALAAAFALLACAHAPQRSPEPEPMVVRGQKVPVRPFVANAADFTPEPGVAALHYYGAGGWGILWRGTYVVAAPYFSNHPLGSLLASSTLRVPLKADLEAIEQGTVGTPIATTRMLLIGHGHVDHSGDVPALFESKRISSRPVLMADRSTVNQLAALSKHFECVAPVDYWQPEAASTACPVPEVRVAPILNAHAPHLNVAGLEVAGYGGVVPEARTAPPDQAPDFKLGITWGYLIDLLDERGGIAFRIHYLDAVGTPPHGLAPKALVEGRDVDVHIGCVPGFEQSDYYPDAVLTHHKVKYVMLGHWEDFFQPRTAPLMPLRNVLDTAAIERFIDAVRRDLPKATGVAPRDACVAPRTCGPRGATWALPIPGETFRFATSG